jgi:hypothetical protein
LAFMLVVLSTPVLALALGTATAQLQAPKRLATPAACSAACIDGRSASGNADDTERNPSDPARQPCAAGSDCVASVAAGTAVAERYVAPPPLARGPYRSGGFVRGIYGTDSSATGYDLTAAHGFNTVEVGPYREALDDVQRRGLRAYVWMGSWSNDSCSWERDDGWVTGRARELAGHPALLFYYLGDEPLYSACPGGPAAYRQRTALIHRIDPGHDTFTAIQAWDEGAGEALPYQHWVGTVDILGLVIYPCAHPYTPVCNWGEIDQAIAKADRIPIPRYYGLIQAFQDSYYRLPTAGEIHEQFRRWRQSRMEGYLVFNWNYGGTSLESYPDRLRQLRAENAS